MEHNMTKTLKLTGRALELARSIRENVDQTNSQISELKSQADAISKAASKQNDRLVDELRKELELEENACCHLDLDYLDEHGDAYVRTGCERSGGLGDFLSRMFSRDEEDHPSKGDLH